MTPREFSNISEGVYDKRNSEYKNRWEQTRSLMFSVSAPHLKNKNATAQDIILFPWEKNTESIDLNAEIAAVENQKDFWEKMDERRKAVN